MSICILCQTTELDRRTKPEHVLNDALGGRKTTRGAICSGCNEKLGSTVDRELASQVKTLRSMFSMVSGNGQPAPVLRCVKSGEITFNIGGDGRLELVAKPFEITHNPDGTFSLQITARSEAEVAQSFAHAAAALKMTTEELIAKTAQATGRIENRPPGVVMHPMSFGGLECSRSMMKSALVLWSTEVGNEELHKACYDEARDFVLNGSSELETSLTATDERYIEGHEMLEGAFGPLYNYIAVASGLMRTGESGLGFRAPSGRASLSDAHRCHRPAEPDRSRASRRDRR